MVTAEDFKRNLRDTKIPKGTKSMADYEQGKRQLDKWRWDMKEHGIEMPHYEVLIKVVADWVGV